MRLKIIRGNKPIKVDVHNWIYHDKKGGIQLIHEVYSKGFFVQTDSIFIRRQILSKMLTQEKLRLRSGR